MRFDRLGADDGLSQQAVNAIAQDAVGFMWFGTEDGLDRYDGYTFQHARHDRADRGSLPNDFVADIQLDSSGVLWMATDGAGVVRRDPAHGDFRSILEGRPQDAVSGLERVRLIRLARQGGLWIGSRDGGLAFFEPGHARLVRWRHDARNPGSLRDDSIFALLPDRLGGVWVGTQTGLDRFEPESGTFRHYDTGALAALRVRALFEDSAGALWIGTDTGLVRLECATGTQTVFRHGTSDQRQPANPPAAAQQPAETNSLPADQVNVMLEDSRHRLWVGTSDGLALFDRDRNSFHTYRNDPADPSSLPDNHILSLREDRTGLLWIGTRFGGAARFNPRTWTFGQHVAGPEEGMASANINAFTEDRRGRLWIATFGGGITIVDATNGQTTTLRQQLTDGLSDDRVMALLADREGAIWAGTMAGGLDRIDPESQAVTVYAADPANPLALGSAGIMSLLEDSAGRLWIGTYGGGLSRFDRASGTFRRYLPDPADPTRLAAGRVTALAEDPSGRLWVGTDGGGLHVLDPEAERFYRLSHDPRDPRSLSAATVYCLHVTTDGTVWVGTRGGGLDKVLGTAMAPETIHFENFTTANGLPNNTVYGVESGVAGNLWLSTNHGLARFDPRSGRVRAFHRGHGLQEEEFNFGAHYASPTGRLYFGGAKGYNAFDPNRLAVDDSPPPVVLTGASALDRPLTVAQASAPGLTGLHLHYHDAVTLDFAALDFAAPRANSFDYWLEGFDRDWERGGTRHSVTYTNLPGGHYTLRVRAANPDGTWNEQGLAIPLDVDPPPWATWWAFTGYGGAFVLLVTVCWLAHLRSLVREESYSQRLHDEVISRTRELAERNAELEIVNRRLEEASLTDPLTKLGNRRSLMRDMPKLIAVTQPDARRPPARMTLMLVDLDHLKPINDQYGHEAGDQVLEQVAALLRGHLRESDRVVRWGGDEFVIVRSPSDLEDAAALAERIRTSLARRRFPISSSRSARTSCSIGFACYPFIQEAPLLSGWEEVLNLADMALYRAKARRNAWLGWCGRPEAAEVPELLSLLATDPSAAVRGGYIDTRASPGEAIDIPLRRQSVAEHGR